MTTNAEKFAEILAKETDLGSEDLKEFLMLCIDERQLPMRPLLEEIWQLLALVKFTTSNFNFLYPAENHHWKSRSGEEIKVRQITCELNGCISYTQLVPEDHYHHVETKVQEAGSEGANSYRVPIAWRFDLIPPMVLRELAAVYEEGAVKYGDAKYIEKPLPASVIVNHMWNHFLQWCSGDRSELHMAKVIWGACTLIVLEDMAAKGLIQSTNDLSAYGAKMQEALSKRLDNIDAKTQINNSSQWIDGRKDALDM